MTKTLEDLKTGLEYVTEHLDFGNGDVDIEDSMIDIIIEAPNHTTLHVQFMDEDIEKLKSEFMETYIIKTIEAIDWFDPEDTFNELWSTEFGEHNGFTAFQFVDILKEDERFFKEEKERLQKCHNQILLEKYNNLLNKKGENNG